MASKMSDAQENRTEHERSTSQASVSMKRCWHVVCVPGIYPAESGLARQQSLADKLTGQSATPALQLWCCHPALLVTRSETRLPHFDGAAAEMQAEGWPVLLCKSGGEACPVGSGTVQVSMIEAASSGATLNAKYAVLAKLIQRSEERRVGKECRL